MATSNSKKGAGGPAGKGLRVVAKKDGFRRAGRVFTGDAQVIPYEDLTAEEVEQLTTESMLVVMEVDLPKAAEAETAKK